MSMSYVYTPLHLQVKPRQGSVVDPTWRGYAPVYNHVFRHVVGHVFRHAHRHDEVGHVYRPVLAHLHRFVNRRVVREAYSHVYGM